MSLTTHQNAMAIDWEDRRLVVEAKLDVANQCVDIAIPGFLCKDAHGIATTVSGLLGYRVGSMVMGIFHYSNRAEAWRDEARAFNPATGNGRYYVRAYINDKIAPPCPICKSVHYAFKPWGKPHYHCRGCKHDYGTAAAYTNAMGEPINILGHV